MNSINRGRRESVPDGIAAADQISVDRASPDRSFWRSACDPGCRSPMRSGVSWRADNTSAGEVQVTIGECDQILDIDIYGPVPGILSQTNCAAHVLFIKAGASLLVKQVNKAFSAGSGTRGDF